MANAPVEESQRGWSLPLGRVLGIEIRVHLSFVLIVAVVALGASAPEGPGLVAGLVWVGVVFGCVVVHELAHSVVARSRGATVREILLLPIGGVSRLEHLPENPRDEFAIAVVGPAASVALAGAAAMVALAAGVPLVPVTLFAGPFLTRVVWLNLLLAGFNLLPAFPMDGGRVFRSILERRYDLETATRLAARLGRAVAIGLVAIGVLVNVWFVIIGVFVYFGASAEEIATVVHVRLRGMRVRDAMLRDPITFESDVLAVETADVDRRSAQRVYPVTEGGRYVGLADAPSLASAPSATRVVELARGGVPTLTPGDPLEEVALPALHASGVHAVAVVDRDEHVVGLLSEADVMDVVERRRTMPD